MKKFTLKFDEINMNNIPQVGGKNASLGEMIQNIQSKGIKVPDGFATTAYAYRYFLEKNNIYDKLAGILNELDKINFSNLSSVGARARELILNAQMPQELRNEIIKSYEELKKKYKYDIQVAVRSSATAEDLPTASFAGQQESYLNITEEEQLIKACVKCYASLFTNRAIKYREDNNFEHLKIALSCGIQKMVRSDKACAGVCFTLDPESGFEKVVYLTGSWGLGENVVQGNVNPDEFYVFKPSLKLNKKAVISRTLGTKSLTMVYAENNESESSTLNTTTEKEKRNEFILNNEEIEALAKWAMVIEEYYKRPMDIEWAKDGISNELYIVQARPETVQSAKKDKFKIYIYTLKEKGKIVTYGKSVGSKIASGKARVLNSPAESDKLKEGEVLVTDITTPDWDPIMKRASAIITNKGGRTSHAAIVAREIGVAAIVGTENSTEVIKDGQDITVSCVEGENGIVYDGVLKWQENEVDTRKIMIPKTKVMLILGDPDQAFNLSFLPNSGVGLMRLEFVINNALKIHPMALVKFNQLKNLESKQKIEELTKGYSSKEGYFTDKLSQAVATIAAAFYPNDVIVRMSDFKSNEYAKLIGGDEFEPKEDNPMLGFRGASRYYNPRYKEGFKLECQAMKIVRDEMGLTNVKLMIPFCRTIEEAKKVINVMNEYGLKQKENDLEIYVMAEIPSNILLADEFAKVFNGFSIGSNDLTQLTLGIDRDSEIISNLFDEKNEATKKMIEILIKKAKNNNIPVGLCGQAPSDFPEFAQFLVAQGITSISFNPDALISGITNINEAEKKFVDK